VAELAPELLAEIDAAWREEQARRNGARAEGLTFVSLGDFVRVAEPSARSLLGTPEETVLPVGGDLLVYGAGGAGKTTWTIDAVAHLAAGAGWLGLEVPAPLTVCMIENEGPRGKFREKLRHKAEAWPVEDRVHVLEEPWARFTFGSPQHRQELARFLNETGTDLLVSGPLSTLGMVGGGTPDEINRFVALIGELRALVDHPLAHWAVHHENRAGQVSGAWERVPDTLVHLTARGNGHARVFWQKARWSSDLHGTSMNLTWAEGATYTVDEPSEPATAERIRDGISEFVLANGGASWNAVDSAVSGKGELKRSTRTEMLSEGVLVNTGGGNTFKLWHRDDPARPNSDQLRPSGDAPGDAP
jgi:hypothetical protein